MIVTQKTLLRLSSLLALASLTACAGAAKNNDVAADQRQPAAASDDGIKYDKIDAGDGHVTVINTLGKTIESPVVSSDGRKIIVISDLAGKAPVDMIVKDLTNPRDLGMKMKKPLLNLFIKGSFMSTDDRIVACELEWTPRALPETLEHYMKTKEWDPIGYHSVISFYKNGKRVHALDDEAFHLPDHTFLEHPRVSPDQKWLTFYVQPSTEMPSTSDQGIYVYNFETKKTYYLGNFADKHPTWSPDGQRIFFHEQGALGKVEIARVGYYDLQINGDVLTGKNRVVFSDPGRALGSTYIYQKHPAYHAGLRTVFFHVKAGSGCATEDEVTAKAADGKPEDKKCSKAIGAFSIDHPDRDPVLIKLTYHGKKVSHAEHVDVSDQPNSPLYFVGRVEGEKNDRLLRVDFSVLQQAAAELNRQ